MKKALKNQIPKILHYIWISNPKHKKMFDMPKAFYDNAFKTKKLAENEGWTLNLWVDNKTQNLAYVNQLKNAGFKINNVDDAFKSNNPIVKKQKEIFDLVDKVAIKVDILKYQLLKEFGGIINDLNFIYRKLPSIQQLNDNELILYRHADAKKTKFVPENCFMGSAPKHKFINTIQESIAKKMNENAFCINRSEKLPQSILDIYKSHNKMKPIYDTLERHVVKSHYCEAKKRLKKSLEEFCLD